MKNLCVKDLISVLMFMFLVFVMPTIYVGLTKERVPTTDEETVAAYDRKIAEYRSQPIAQMTGEPIGYFDENLRWVPFDRTEKAR